MRGVTLAALCLLGCESEQDRSAPTAPPAPIEVRVLLDGAPRAGGGDVVVQADYDDVGQVELSEPKAPGLAFSANGPPRVEDLIRPER